VDSSHYFGAHVQDDGGIDMAARRAGRAGMTALQVFTAVPKFYGDKATIRPERAQRFRQALADAALDPRRVMAHGAYVLNVASAEPEKWSRAAAGLAKELERATTLGLGGVCFHPGSAGKNGDRWEAVARVAEAMTRALESVSGDTMLWIENTAGAGARASASIRATSSRPGSTSASPGRHSSTCSTRSSRRRVRHRGSST
jgi:deoxyribonuclease-4